MVCYNDCLPVACSCQRLEDIALRFLEQIDCLLRHEPCPVSLLDHDKVVHVLPGVLHLEEVLPKKIRPEGCPDKQDTVDFDGLVFQEMNVPRKGQLGLQLLDAPEEIVVIEKVVPFNIDDGQESLGQEADNVEPGLLPVGQSYVPGNQSNGFLVSWQRWDHHAEDPINLVGLPEFGMKIGKGTD